MLEALGQGRGLLDSPCQHEPFLDAMGNPLEVSLMDNTGTMAYTDCHVCKKCRCVYVTDGFLQMLGVDLDQ